MFKRLLKISLKVLLLLVVLIFLFLLFERFRGEISLAHYKRELIAKGETLDVRKLTGPPVADADNGAPLVYAAAKQLTEGPVVTLHNPPKMRLTPAGHAVVGFREDTWIDAKTNYNWEQLAAELKANEPALAQIRVGLEKPAFDNKLDYSLGPNMKLTHLGISKKLTYWFGGASQLALRQGKNGEAAENLIAQIRLLRLPAEDHVIISELVRDAIAAIAKMSTWEALQADGWNDEDLKRIQEAWQEPNFITATSHSFEGERICFGDSTYALLRISNEETIKAIYSPEQLYAGADENPTYANIMKDIWKRQAYCRIWRLAWSHQDQRRYLQAMQTLIDMAQGAAREKSYAKEHASLDRFDMIYYSRNFYDDWRFPISSVSSFRLAITKALRAETERSITVCAIALKRYALRHGNYPASLEALAPEFISSVPVDYMDGKPMKYHLNADSSFTLYSVGEDGKDDGGDASLVPPERTYYQNLWERKDFVWPQPATADEAKAWREKEAAKN